MLALSRVVNRDRNARCVSDAGMTLVEVVVAMAIVVTGLLALLGEFTTYLHQQRSQRAHAYALRVATSALEDARRLPLSSLPAGATTMPPQTHDGVSYTTTTQVDTCDPSVQTSCQAPAANGPSVARVGVSVSWSDATGPHHLDLSTADADTQSSSVSGSNSGLTNNTTGTTGSVSLASFSVTPNPVGIDASAHPTSDITLRLVVSGLASSTSISATWTDDTGNHHATLTNSSGNTWTTVVQKSQITRTASVTSSSVTFTATVPGLSTLPTATLTVLPQATLSNCHVTPSPIVLVTLTRRTSLPEVLSCSATGISASDGVTAGYASGTGTSTASMSSNDGGSTWTVTLPAGTTMVDSGSTESFTFTLTRGSDGYTTSTGLSAALA